jgi:hypothetical protein
MSYLVKVLIVKLWVFRTLCFSGLNFTALEFFICTLQIHFLKITKSHKSVENFFFFENI